MFNLKQNLGVQSYCFRGFKPLPDLIAQVKAIGINQIELCGVHVDFNNESTFEDAIAPFKTAGIAISSIGVQTFRNDPVAEEKWFRFAKLAGAKMLSINLDVKALPAVIPAVEKLAEKYDLVMGIHNHGGYHWLGNFDMVSHIIGNSGPRLGLCLDTAWCLQSGEDPLKWVEKLSPRLFGVHVKDFTFDRAGKWTDVIVGTGNLKLKELLALAVAAPNIRTITLEYEGDIQNPGPALKECVDAVRQVA
jgi:sugar phosphate isomerase/epimerase